MTNNLFYAAVQNGIILDVFDSREEALSCIQEEQKKDWFSILTKRSVRKLLKKRGNNVALHTYSIFKVVESEDIK